MVIELAEFGPVLGTRRLGEQVRHQIQDAVAACPGKIVLDFDGVEMATNSFADECFGKLSRDMGFAQLRERTTAINASRLVGSIVKQAIVDRQEIVV